MKTFINIIAETKVTVKNGRSPTVDGYGYPEGFRSVIYHMIRCILARPTNLIMPGTKMSISCPGQSESQSASHNPHTTRIAVIDLSYMHICLLKATTRP
jgi:hypothetical protein